MVGVVVVGDVDLGAHPAELGQPLEAVLEDRLVDVRGARRLGQQDATSAAGGRSRGPGRARSRCRPARKPAGAERRRRRPRSCRRRSATPTPARSSDVEERRQVVARRARQGDLAAGHRAGDGERARLDAVGHDVVLGAAQALACRGPRSCRGTVRSTSAPIFWRKAIRSSTSGSWAAGRMTVWPSARVAASIAFSVPMTDTNGKRISRPAEAARRRREVVAVAVLDRRRRGPASPRRGGRPAAARSGRRRGC